MVSLSLFEAVFLSCAFLAHLFYRYQRRPQLPYPPGPKPLPLIGNALDIPIVKGFQVFAEWSKQYNSDILYLGALGKHIVVLNSVEAASELCGERSSSYSSRPQLTMCGELMNATRFLAVMPYSDIWRARRRVFQQHFPPSKPSRITISRSEKFIRKYLLPTILNDPKNFFSHIRNSVSGITLSLAYGFKIRRFNDPWIKYAELVMSTTTEAAIVGKYLVDIIPALKYVPEWMPGAGFQKVAREGRKIVNGFFEQLFDAAVKEIDEGIAQPSFVSLALEEEGNKSQTLDIEEIIRATAADFSAGGTDTVVASVQNFVLLMVLHPDVQEKAKKEVDAIVGSNRLPTFDDKASMPYLSAVLKEVLRWRPIVPAGMPHYSATDDVYRGYFIPKGSIIINNAWAMLHNEKIFPNPDRFDPSRFLTETGELKAVELDPEVVATFGFGRRICPGAQVALATIFVAAASLLATFDILKPFNEKGEEVNPTVHYSGRTMVDHPTPFDCRFIPRSKAAAALIQSEVFDLDEGL